MDESFNEVVNGVECWAVIKMNRVIVEMDVIARQSRTRCSSRTTTPRTPPSSEGSSPGGTRAQNTLEVTKGIVLFAYVTC